MGRRFRINFGVNFLEYRSSTRSNNHPSDNKEFYLRAPFTNNQWLNPLIRSPFCMPGALKHSVDSRQQHPKQEKRVDSIRIGSLFSSNSQLGYLPISNRHNDNWNRQQQSVDMARIVTIVAFENISIKQSIVRNHGEACSSFWRLETVFPTSKQHQFYSFLRQHVVELINGKRDSSCLSAHSLSLGVFRIVFHSVRVCTRHRTFS